MRVAVNTNYKGNATEACLHDLAEKFAKAEYDVSYNNWDNYQDYDLVIFVGNDSEARKAKQINPKILTGILCPYLDEKRHREESKAADFLLVDSLEMREVFLKYNKNIIVYYIFPETEETARNHIAKDKIIINYHGNKTHLSCMDNLSKALDELALKHNIEFRAIYNIKRYGKWKKNLPKRCPVRHIQWLKEDFRQNLMQSDIGVIPAKVPINLSLGRITTRLISSFFYNWPRYYREDYLLRFKHATNPGRVYVFSQLGIPVVADFMPSYCQIIEDGKSGFLVYSQEGWYNALEKLILSPELRNELSWNLRDFINSNCSPEINFQKLLKFIENLKLKI